MINNTYEIQDKANIIFAGRADHQEIRKIPVIVTYGQGVVSSR